MVPIGDHLQCWPARPAERRTFARAALLDGTVEVVYVHGFSLLSPREEALAGSIAAAVLGDQDAQAFLQQLVEEDALGPDTRSKVELIESKCRTSHHQLLAGRSERYAQAYATPAGPQ
jgi:hypothetical protein